jgi:predicted metalloprotease
MSRLSRRTIQTLTLALVLAVLTPLFAARPAPASAEMVTVEEVVEYMVPFLDQYWAEASSNWGIAYVSPNAVWYYNTPDAPGSVESGCGQLAVNNAFYCWTDWSIYLDYSWLNEKLTQYGDYAVAAVIAHEWGHHIEQVLGMPNTEFYSIQLELFADCLTGTVTAELDWLGALEVGDLEEAYNLALTIGDPIGTDPAGPTSHGTSDQRIESFVGGYLGGVEDCGATVDALVQTA